MKKEIRLLYSRCNISFGNALFMLCRRNIFQAKHVVVAFLGIALLINSTEAYSQSNGKKITFELRNQPLEKGIQQLEKLSGFRFTYSTQQVAAYQNITVEKGTRTLSSTLDLLLKSTKLTFRIQGEYVQIMQKGEAHKKTAAQEAGGDQAQPVKGTVIDRNGEPLPGVSVRVKDSEVGTVTDVDGNYSLVATPGDVLVYSFIGFFPKEERVSAKTIYDQTLISDSKLLDEVQVIGYGTTTRRLKTSGVATIKTEDITNQVTSTNFLQTMQGKLAGVFISQTNGGVGSSPNIYIRGVNSISSGNSPLYIVDGVIVSDQSLEKADYGLGGFVGGRNALSSINTSDVVSIDVLKDADATAIYGSRGANGVVLITTKKAEIGKTAFTLDASTGFNAPIFTKYLNADQYMAFRKEAFAVNGVTPNATNAPDLTTWANNPITNWEKYMNGNSGRIYNIAATLTGGSKSLSYLASVNYSENHDVIFMDPSTKKVSGKLNLNHVSENNKFRASFNVLYSNDKFTPGMGSASSASANGYLLPPNFPLKDADGNYTWNAGAYGYRNPEAEALSTATSKTINYLISTDLSYMLYKGLTLKLGASFNYQNNDNEVRLYPLGLSPTSMTLPGVNRGFTTFNSYNVEPQLTYTTKLGKGTFDALLGTTWFSKTTDYYTLQLTGYTSTASYGSLSAATNKSIASSNSRYHMRSWFSRLGYNWDNKYIANFTYRADGSSRFGTDNRWGHFWALGGAWLYSNETFVKNALPWLSFGKLRASYGITGNDNIANYMYLSLFSATNGYNGSPVYLSTYLPNKSIKWEQTGKLEVALENGFLNDRVTTSLAYFFNRTTKMLLGVPTAGQTGFSYQLQNFQGIVDNKGLEIEINTTNIKTKDLEWKTNFNITFQKNALTKLPDEVASTYQYSYVVGKPLVNFKSYKTAGINPADGSILWVDPADGSAVSTHGTDPEWNQYLGSSLPSVFGGLANSFTYKGFTLDFSISFAKQTMVDALYAYGYPVGSAYNVPAMVLGNYWQKEGDEKRYPKLDVSGSQWGDLLDAFYSNLYMRDGYYFKLQNVSLAYAIPAKLLSKTGIRSLSVYVRGQNLGYWTPGNTLGKDPEQTYSGGASLLRSFVTGLNIKF